MFPQMVQGYTDEGNAIIINKGNVEELTKAYEEQKKAYQDLVITKSADTFAGYKAKVAETPWTESLKGKNGTYAYIEQKKYIDELIKSLEDGEQAFENFYSNQYIKNSDIYNVLNSATKTAGIDWGGVMDTDKRYEQMKSQMTKLYAYQRQLISNINTETSKIKPIMSAYMGQSYDYQSLDSDVQDVVKQIVGQFDSEFYTQFDNETDMATWVTENIVNKFKGIDGEKITEAFKNSIDLKTKLQNGEISLDDYLSGINEFKMLIDGFDDNTKKSVDLIFNVNSSNGLSTDTLVNNVKEKLQDDFDGKVGELTLEELHIAAEQVEVPEGTLLSWDELIAKIKEVQSSTSNIENPISFDITTYKESIDSIQSTISTLRSALDSFNQGTLDESAVIDLMQQFPSLAPYIDLTADGFGNLSEGLSELISQQPDSLIQSLEQLKDSLTTDAEREQVDLLIDSLQRLSSYGDSGIEAYATTIGNTFGDTSNVIEGVINQFENLAKVQEAVADGLTMSATAAAELAKMYPEILTNAQVTADGQITLNEEVVRNILDGDKSIIDAQITKLEADKAGLTAKRDYAEAQLNIAKQVAEGEGKRYCPLPQ